MKRFWLLGLLLVVLSLVLVSGIGAYDIPNLRMPFDDSLLDEIQFSSGPHAPTSTNTQEIVDINIASGIDFAGGNNNWDVLSMSSGWVTFVGLSNSSLGNIVVIKTEGFDSYLVYAHLSSFSDEIRNEYQWGDSYIERGTKLGVVGGSGGGGTQQWPIHLHVDLRAWDWCTQFCLTGTDIIGVQRSQIVGNPLSWWGQQIDGYFIQPYCTSSSCNQIYNYDGIALRSYWGAGPAVWYGGFRFQDTKQGASPINRTGVYIAGVPTGYCTSGMVDCEQNTLIDASIRDYVIFSGKGSIGSGGFLISTNTQPEGSSGGSSGGGSVGDSAVDIREYKNYTGSQYGSSDPNAGIINIPGGQNDRNESIQIDAGWSVMVYQEFNGGGGKRCFNQSIPNLEYSVFDNSVQVINGISSFRVYSESTCGGQMPVGVAPGDTVTVYAGFNWEGTKYGGHGTAVFNLPDYIEGATSSIGVYPGKSALLYEFDNQQGGTQCFSGSDPDLRDNFYHNGHVIDDNIHSLRLFENGNCGGWNPPAPIINGLNFSWTSGTSVHLAFVYENANPNVSHTVAWTCDVAGDVFSGATNAVNLDHTCPTTGSVSAVITVYGYGNFAQAAAEVTIPDATATPTHTPTATATATNTDEPTATPTNTVEPQGIELLSRTLSVSANDGADEDWVDPPSWDVLIGMDFVRITYNLHGLCALGGDASAFVFNQSEWMYISLSDYGQNCLDGVQVVDVPLTDFWNHSGTEQLVPEEGIGGVRLRFWYDDPYTVEVFSAVAMTNETLSPTETPVPSDTPMPTATDTPQFTETPTSTLTATATSTPTATATNTPVPTNTTEPTNEVELLPQPWVLDGGFGAEELYQGIDENALVGMDTLRVTYNLHGLNAYGGDASALIFDQNGWQYASLSNYGQTGYDGVQVVEIPLSHFGSLNPNAEVGTFHTRFWCDYEFYVEILSAVAFDSPNY